MKTGREYVLYTAIPLLFVLLISACKQEKRRIKVEDLSGSSNEKRKSEFIHLKVAEGNNFIWSKKTADVTSDELVDLVFYSDNGAESFIGYCIAQREDGPWKINVVSKLPWIKDSIYFDILHTVDVDGDHDNDIIGFKKSQVSGRKNTIAELLWYENLGHNNWKPHSSRLDIDWPLNEKVEVDFTDFDNDNKIDFSLLTSDSNMFIFKQITVGAWKKVQLFANKRLHSNVELGDVNGDKFLDIVSSGLIYYNPGSDLSKPWRSEELNRKWNNYEEGNASSSKTVLKDVDFDGKVEIYMAPNKVSGYPLIAYKEVSGSWQYRILKDSIPANEQLQVIDFDRDMDTDLITTQSDRNSLSPDNQKRVVLIENDGSYINYQESILDSIYVGHIQALDFDLDGDVDIFLYPKENTSEFSILVNTKIWNGSF